MPYNKKKTVTAAAEYAGEEFVGQIKLSSPKAVAFGRSAAVARFMRLTRSDSQAANDFYNKVKSVMANSHIVLNMDVEVLGSFIRDGKFSPADAHASESGRFNHLASKRTQAERAMGCHGMNPVYASLTRWTEGDRSFGSCSVVLSGLGERLVMLSGDSARIRNQASPDFVTDPKLVLYAPEDLADCRAAAAIMGLPERILLSGADMAFAELTKDDREYGQCDAMVFGGVDIKSVSQIIVESDAAAVALRVAMDAKGKLCPVSVSKKPITVYGQAADPQEPASKPSVPQQHFRAGDRVAMKPQASNPSVLGTIMDVASGAVTVRWDDSQSAVYDMAEALMRVMAAPEAPKRIDGMVAYSLPGMDDDTVLALSMLGIDPVSVYTIASHGRPASPSAEWWEQALIKSLSGLGINAYMAKGFVKNSGADTLAFVPHKWLEARLPGGSRLVVDVSSSDITIRAGDPEDYILPSPDSKVVFE